MEMSCFVRLYTRLKQQSAKIMMNMVTIHIIKNLPTIGMDLLDSGIVSTTNNMKTVVANISVTATDRLSPHSAGKMKVVIDKSVVRAQVCFAMVMMKHFFLSHLVKSIR